MAIKKPKTKQNAQWSATTDGKMCHKKRIRAIIRDQFDNCKANKLKTISNRGTVYEISIILPSSCKFGHNFRAKTMFFKDYYLNITGFARGRGEIT